MRPIRVEMTAFGPYAGTEVADFRELGDNRLFLIHGPTGAGKTSILDAISFALYGETSGAERQAGQMRSHLAPDDRPTEVVLDFRPGRGGVADPPPAGTDPAQARRRHHRHAGGGGALPPHRSGPRRRR